MTTELIINATNFCGLCILSFHVIQHKNKLSAPKALLYEIFGTTSRMKKGNNYIPFFLF